MMLYRIRHIPFVFLFLIIWFGMIPPASAMIYVPNAFNYVTYTGSGYQFSNWSGYDSPSVSLCGLTMNRHINVTANFTTCSDLPAKRAGLYILRSSTHTIPLLTGILSRARMWFLPKARILTGQYALSLWADIIAPIRLLVQVPYSPGHSI